MPLNAWMHTGTQSVESALEEHLFSQPPQRVALDIETHGLKAGRWSITCVTFAFYGTDGVIHGVMLNPLRVDRDRELVKRVCAEAGTLVLHNGVFDIPVLYNHRLMEYADINKVEDTILLSRMIRTGMPGGRTLSDLSGRYGIAVDSGVSIETSMRAAGFANKEDGYTRCDIDRDFYRRGAIADTIATLALWGPLYDDVINELSGRPGLAVTYLDEALAVTYLDEAGAHDLVRRVHVANRVVLRSCARGLRLDRGYIERWKQRSSRSIAAAERLIKAAGLRIGVGADIVTHLDAIGELPTDWPRTDKGALKADKKAMEQLEKLGHPIARAHTLIAEREKNHNYFKGMEESALGTGRVHPQINVLGAAASGRMSGSSPAVQQFSAEARPAIVSDEGDLWSVDWSSIEPVVLANCAGDHNFISPFNDGGDLYIPLAKAAGLMPADISDKDAKDHPGRKKSKVMLLAQMYGQGLRSLAAANGWTVDEAASISEAIKSAMAPTFSFMNQVQSTCKRSGYSHTITGRLLDERMIDKSGRQLDVKDRVAVNHFCQGSAADVLLETTVLLEEMGYGDHILLWVHDELVVTEEALEATKTAMSTVPESMTKYIQSRGGDPDMKPILRIDAQNMGHHWQKV